MQLSAVENGQYDCFWRPVGRLRHDAKLGRLRVALRPQTDVPISTSVEGRGQMRQNPDRIFTTTSRDADMAGDEPAVQREWTRAGAGRLQGKGSKLVGSRQVHKHR